MKRGRSGERIGSEGKMHIHSRSIRSEKGDLVICLWEVACYAGERRKEKDNERLG